MVVLEAIDAFAAMRAGVRFYSSSNSVVLTPDIIPPSAILHYEASAIMQSMIREGVQSEELQK